MSKECLNCGNTVPDVAKFCPKCGTSEFKDAQDEFEVYAECPTRALPPLEYDFQPPVNNQPPYNYQGEVPPLPPEPPKKDKKGLIIGIIAAVLLVAVLAGVAVLAYFKKNDGKTDNSTMEKSSSVEEETEEIIADDPVLYMGGTAEASPSDGSSISETETSSGISSASSTNPTKPSGSNDKTKPSTPSNNPTSKSDNNNYNASADDLLNDGTTTAATTLRDDIIGNSIKNRKFTISTTIIREEGSFPVTLSMDGNNMATRIKISGLNARIIMKDGKTYMAVDAPMKMYAEISGNEYDISTLMPTGKTGTYVGSTTVKDGNKTYICEEYKSGSTVTKYYFLNNKWARYEIIDGSNIAILEISDFKGSADASLFDLSGYSEVDMEDLR